MIKRPVSISWSANKDLNTTNFVKMVGDYVCNMCGKQFMAKKGLSDHNWAVHEQVESPCNFCDKIFRSKKHLAVHISNTHAEHWKETLRKLLHLQKPHRIEQPYNTSLTVNSNL